MTILNFDPKHSNQLLQYQNTSLPHIPNSENIFDFVNRKYVNHFFFFLLGLF